jgi:hypothetical protein
MFTRPSFILHVEYAVLLLAAVTFYQHLHFSWLLFAVLFLVPDLSMLGYMANPRLGSALYNCGHAIFFPVLLCLLGFVFLRFLPVAVGIIWFSHIVFDRMLGYGLKYPTHFKDTHLQHLG